MRHTALLTLLLTGPAAGQVAPDDFVLSLWDGSPDVAIVRPDGTVLQTFTSPIAPGRCQGAMLTPNQEILTGRWLPAGGFTLFGVGGGTTEFDPPSLSFIGDTAVLASGELLVANQDGHVDVFSPTGVHQFQMGAAQLEHPWGLFVDIENTVWVGDLGVGHDLFRFHADGTFMTSLELGFDPGDIVRSPDGTLWVIDEDTGIIRQFAIDGTLLTTIQTFTLGQHASGLAMEADGTLVASAWDSPSLHRYAQDGTALGSIGLNLGGGVLTISRPGDSAAPLGSSYCGPAVANSSGQAAEIIAVGSILVGAGAVQLIATDLPPNQWGFFLNSRTPGLIMPPGSQGNLCLAGQIGRYNANILNSGAGGGFALQLDLTDTPTPNGSVPVMVGEQWRFQAWFRDQNPSTTSNFTDGVVLDFL